MRLIAIVLGEDDSKKRNNEAMGLLDYGFNNYKFNKLKTKNSIIKKISLDKADKDSIDILLNSDLGVVEDKNSTKHNYKYEVKINNIKLPIKKNSVIGKIIVKEKNKKVGNSSLIIKEDIDNINYFGLLINNLKKLVSGNY